MEIEWAWDSFRTPVGWCTLAVAGGKLRRLQFHKSVPGGNPVTKPFRNGVLAYFDGLGLPDFPLDLSWATPFGRAVYDVVFGVPRGKVLTYGKVAERAGFGQAARAVGGAMGRNQICLSIP